VRLFAQTSAKARSAPPPLPRRCCATCAHFRSDPRELEKRIPGLGSLGSAFAAVRSADGLCERHHLYLAASACCTGYEARERAAARRADSTEPAADPTANAPP
jgi:hypothetical protein